MPASEARIRANQQNALRSTGPKTSEGKERSRRNGLKHGMTGQGIVLAADHAAEVAARNDDLQAEFAPRTTAGAHFIHQMASLSVRVERCVQQESAAIALRVRHAADDFDESRIAQAEGLLDSIGENPRRHLRRLRKMPEGVELLIEAWNDLRADLTRQPNPSWTPAHLVKAANLCGIREENADSSIFGVYSRRIWGDLKDQAGEAESRAKLVEEIDARIAELEEHDETLDHEMIALDRAEAGQRALFDPSKEATLARRYESEARRGFFKALKEFRQVEAEAMTGLASEPDGRPAPKPPADDPSLGSSWDAPDPLPGESFEAYRERGLRHFAAVEAATGRAFPGETARSSVR